MTLPVRGTEGAPSALAEKALALWRRLGLAEPALDELLGLAVRPPGERRAAPRAAPSLPLALDPLRPLRGPRGQPERALAALSADPQALAQIGGGGAAAEVERLRLLLSTRDALIDLALLCEVAAGALAESLEGLVRGLRGGPSEVLPRMRAARDRTLGRGAGILLLSRPSR